MADRPYVVTPEQWKESAISLSAEIDRIEAIHASIIDQGRKVLNATSDIGMSHAEYIEWVMGKLEGK